jgi:hypothetical protein
MAETGVEDPELREMIMRYRKMEEETSDPMAMQRQAPRSIQVGQRRRRIRFPG